MTRVPGAIADSIDVRLFAPDYHPEYDALDATADRIVRLLNGYVSRSAPGVFQYAYRMPLQNGGQFEDVVYTEITFDVMTMYPVLEVTV